MIYINGVPWRISIVSPDNSMLRRPNGTYSIGVCDNTLLTIFISGGLNPHKLKNVICHEIAHAVMFSYNLQLSVQQEELMAELIANYGEEILRQTKKVYNKIKESLY